ncbi:hypothetical protein LZG74_10330 [Dyadobacter sp. CY327]|uniref:glycosyl-4,4'-diaponeurosporenoate acyltransferase CrtO family protein n=1 Tax=Dyadobacter sp. CY327 TaxID=2907301 RepID=UPI001F490E51|nr:hypothetical protein [Dyadobacter sp. CY327]MCE7070702.1 hypothetical protein [Dyadobacter sp. CY327]
MKKALILILTTGMTIGSIYALIHYIGMQSFSFAWILNFLLMASVLTFTETIKSPLTSPYFDTKPWERKGEIYESFGINFYRKILVLTGWEKLNKKANPIAKNINDLTHLYYKTKQSELGHIIILFVVFSFNIFVAFQYGIVKSLWLFILNILLNLYPVLLQRYNRPRIARAISLSKF